MLILAADAGVALAQQRGLAVTVGFGVGVPLLGPLVTMRVRASDRFGWSCGVGTYWLDPIGQCFAEFYKPSDGTDTRVGMAWSLRPLVNIWTRQEARMVTFEIGAGQHRSNTVTPSTLDMALMIGVTKNGPMMRRRRWGPSFDLLAEMGRAKP